MLCNASHWQARLSKPSLCWQSRDLRRPGASPDGAGADAEPLEVDPLTGATPAEAAAVLGASLGTPALPPSKLRLPGGEGAGAVGGAGDVVGAGAVVVARGAGALGVGLGGGLGALRALLPPRVALGRDGGLGGPGPTQAVPQTAVPASSRRRRWRRRVQSSPTSDSLVLGATKQPVSTGGDGDGNDEVGGDGVALVATPPLEPDELPPLLLLEALEEGVEPPAGPPR